MKVLNEASNEVTLENFDWVNVENIGMGQVVGFKGDKAKVVFVKDDSTVFVNRERLTACKHK